MRALLDVNVIEALLDAQHVGHVRAHQRLAEPLAGGWARPSVKERPTRVIGLDLEQNFEARLLEVAIGRERPRYAALLHDDKRCAVGQRPRLVGALRVQFAGALK